MRARETNESELLMKCRKLLDDVKTGVSFLRREGSGGYPVYCPDGIRHRGSVKLVQAFMWNMGTCRPDVKGEIQVGSPHKDESTDAGHRGGAARSSVEGAVMAVERRSGVIQLYFEANQLWDEPYE